MPLVYLAGPIRGLVWDEATAWRDDVTWRLAEYGIQTASPLRFKGFLEGEIKLDDRKVEHPLTTPKGIVTRDRFDCQRADVVLFNFLGATQVSIGSCVELGWADAARRPTVLLMEPSGNPHDHAFLDELAGFRTDSLDSAIMLVLALVGR